MNLLGFDPSARLGGGICSRTFGRLSSGPFVNFWGQPSDLHRSSNQMDHQIVYVDEAVLFPFILDQNGSDR